MNTPSRSLVLHPWYSYTAAVLIISILAWVTGVPGFVRSAQAAPITSISDTLSTSVPGASSDHTIVFTTPTGVPADGSTIEITFPVGFNLGSIIEDDVDIADDGVDLTTAATCGASQAAVSVSSQTLIIEICNGGGGAIGATSVVTIQVGQNATDSGTGVNRIVNHATPDSYELTIGGTMADSGFTRIVILEATTVTGEVTGYFSFSIDGVDANQAVNGDATLTFATTTATTVPFGTVQANTEYVLGQDLSVLTNSENGFAVTVSAASDLVSPSTADINSFFDGNATDTPSAWAPPSATPGDTDTYGHWGLTTEDITLTDNDSFGDALYVGNFINNPREVFYGTSSADGTTAHIGKTRVGFKLEVSILQEAASDYSTSLTYVATPVF